LATIRCKPWLANSLKRFLHREAFIGYGLITLARYKAGPLTERAA